MKTCTCGRTKIMWNTHRVGVTADNIVRYKASSLTVPYRVPLNFLLNSLSHTDLGTHEASPGAY